jgi:Ca2+-transporting ATPase
MSTEGISTALNETTVWHELESSKVASLLDVDPAQGLSTDEAAQRLRQYGPNSLTETEKEPTWHAFLRQYQDYMRIVLFVAAIGSVLIGDFTTAFFLLLITVGSAIMGMHQERKAEDSVAALQKMMNIQARVRRDGQTMEVQLEEIAPGDVVLFEAGDRVPADGRLSLAATLEIEESALTGESIPVPKATDPVAGADAALGDRIDMAYQNTNVTRGRGEMITTGTGMRTEVGHIAGMLQATEEEKSPLQKQVDSLTVIIAAVAGVALVLIILIGASYGATFDELWVLGIALAIAAIPTALPVVVTTILALGTSEMAKRHAVIKKLPAVETLGSTSAICSDKTGTLTLNQMTARVMAIAGRRFEVTGEGYETVGQIRHIGGHEETDLDPYLLPMALCADAVVHDGGIIGDPTEGALVVLAEKGGVMVQATRKEYPRIAEVPFDSDYKFMATFHNMTGDNGRPVVRCYVKGAPDVVLSRSTSVRWDEGTALPLDEPLPTSVKGYTALDLDEPVRPRVKEVNEEFGKQGLRVLIMAERDFDPDTFDPNGDLLSQVEDLTLLAMVGIVDPARTEARDAIAECHSAGIRVRMITGDHAVTAGAIAGQLGIEGRAISGAEFNQMSDEEASGQLDDIGVIARVAPEDKIRLVSLLQAQNKIVAMTGDGVNDAPALKKADIGVAMGITGTDVSKGAAVMILTDDNFATIVGAVEYGRIIYDNLLKYIRFQMAGLFSFILAFLGSAAFGVTLVLFNPMQILFVNYFVQGAIGVTFVFDTATPGLMKRKPRPANEQIMTWSLAIRLIIIGTMTAVVSVGAYQWAKMDTGSVTVAQTMAMVMFSIVHIPFSLSLRQPYESVFRRETFSNPLRWAAYGFIIVALLLLTELEVMQNIFDTAPLTGQQWGICFIVALLFLFVGEIAKFILRRLGVGQKESVDNG